MQIPAPHVGRHRQPVPGEGRRARQSHLSQCSKALLDDYQSLQSAVRDLSPPSTVDLPTSDLFAKPIADLVEAEINRRIADPTIADPMPKVDDLEASRLALRKQRHQARKSLPDPMLSRLRLQNWIGDRQIRSQIESHVDDAEVGVGTDFVATMVVFHHGDASLPVQELRLLGSNTLQDAADALICVLQLNAPALRDVMPSAYFLIEDRFYDDQRAPGAQQLSQAIIEWMRQERRFAHQNLGAFRRGRPTHLARLDEIGFRPGSVYHYVHLGACRHAIMFTEVAILGAGDVRKRAAYPLQTALIKEARQRCGVCDTNAAAFVTLGDRLASTNPFFYCADCYHSMHYSEDGHLLYGGYQVYPYFCD